MKLFKTSARVVGVAAASALAVVAVGVAAPSATAAPCAASGLATTASGVLADAGGYLDAHPGANDVLTAAANQPPDEARSNVRGYFTAHPGEFLDLQRIAQPLKDLRSQCGISISPSQLASLFEALA
jgi:hemophore-related protein